MRWRCWSALIVALLHALGPGIGVARRAEAQPRTARTIGFLCARPGPSSHTVMFERGLRELGYAPGKDVVIDYRYAADASAEAFSGFAADLARRKVDVIVVGSPLALVPARRATATIPLVMAQSDDPVAQGLVATLARPGGNITGLSSMAPDLAVKQLELLKSVAPALTRVAVLWNSASPLIRPLLEPLERAAPAIGVTLVPVPVRAESADIERAFAAMRRARAEALIVLPDMAFFEHIERLVRLSASARLPTVYGDREFVDAGGFMSYGTNHDELFRRAAVYVDKILRGARPGQLPVEQPGKFDLVINVKTATALDLTVPPPLLARADRLVQ